MAGLAKLCKLYGSMQVTDGKKVTWLYDYVNDKPRLNMTKEEIMASEKAKWEGIKSAFHLPPNHSPDSSKGKSD